MIIQLDSLLSQKQSVQSKVVWWSVKLGKNRCKDARTTSTQERSYEQIRKGVGKNTNKYEKYGDEQKNNYIDRKKDKKG